MRGRRHFNLLLALQSILAVLALLDVSHVKYYPMIHRMTIERTFSLGFNPTPLLLILSSATVLLLFVERYYLEALVPILISICLYPLLGLEGSAAVLSLMLVASILYRLRCLQDYISLLLGFMACLEGLALIHWILLPLGICSPLGRIAELEMSLFYVSAHASPILALSFLFMWVLKPLINLSGIPELLSRWIHSTSDSSRDISLNSNIILIIAFSISILAALYPYCPALNPKFQPVGVDVRWYIPWMEEVYNDPFSAFRVAKGSRPLLLLIIYAYGKLLHLGVKDAVIYAPLLLNPILIFSSYFMIYKASGDREWASLTAFLTACSFKIAVGMYSYFLANLLGLALIYSSLGLLNSMRSEDRPSLILASILGSLALFAHPWTLTQFFAALTTLATYISLRDKSFKRSRYIITNLLIIGLIDALKMSFLKGVEIYSSTSCINLKPIGLNSFWRDNIFTFRILYGGLLSNNILFILGSLGAYILINDKEANQSFLSYLLAISSIGYCITHEMMPSRILYNIPIEALATLGMLTIIKDKGIKRGVKMSLMLFIMTYSAAYLSHSLANLL